MVLFICQENEVSNATESDPVIAASGTSETTVRNYKLKL